MTTFNKETKPTLFSNDKYKFKPDTNSSTPLSTQLVNYMKETLLTLNYINYELDDKIESTEFIANKYNIDLETVEKSYKELENMEIIHLKKGDGYFIDHSKLWYKYYTLTEGYSLFSNIEYEFKPNSKSSTPLYVQLANYMKKTIFLLDHLKGRLDHRIESIRFVANKYSINPGTVTKAYKELEKMGIIYSEKGRGYFVLDCKQRVNPNEAYKVIKKHVNDFVVEVGGEENIDGSNIDPKKYFSILDKYFLKVIEDIKKFKDTYYKEFLERSEEEVETFLLKEVKNYISKQFRFTVKELINLNFKNIRENTVTTLQSDRAPLHKFLSEAFLFPLDSIDRFGSLNIKNLDFFGKYSDLSPTEYKNLIKEEKKKELDEALKSLDNNKDFKKQVEILKKEEQTELKKQLQFQMDHILKIHSDIFDENIEELKQQLKEEASKKAEQKLIEINERYQ